MKRCVLLLMVAVGLQANAQDEAATSAPILNPFSLKGDELGSMANYVNQLTGEVVFRMNLVSIPEPGGLCITVSIAYNSANIENPINIWNQEAPTSVLGLGWSMDTPLIMVDNKQTGARDDDDFYLVEGGSSIRLVCVAINSGLYSYRTSNFTNWVITYSPSVEKWEVINGSRFIYGDTQGPANAVQWTARWGNWMCNSVVAGQVEFVLGQKSTDEYQSPPGVVLKGSERFYMNKIFVRTNGVLDYELQQEYFTNELGTGQLTKRLLKSIKKVSPAGTIESTVSFAYVTIAEGNKGALYRVLLPTGGSITFTYSTTGPSYQKQVPIAENAPSGYAEPDVYFSDDYALVTWRELSGSSQIEGPMTTLAKVIEWSGK